MVHEVDSFEFLNSTAHVPVLDVRSPSEYADGHIPGAVSFPLFSDDERAMIGTIFKSNGQEAAMLKGLEVVGPRMKDLASTGRSLAKDNKVAVHCWRGGKRSASVAWLLSTCGLEVTLLNGGYKAYRRTLLEFLEKTDFQFVILGGRTGTRKTTVLHALEAIGEQVVDLEGLANHKGSAFGWIGEKRQPTTQQFENTLFDQLRLLDSSRVIWLENESKTIGRVYLPDALWNKMKCAPLIHMNVDIDVRLEHLVEQYAQGTKLNELKESFGKIERRLGGQNVTKALGFLDAGDYKSAARIALQYYDKTYDYNLENNKSGDIRIIEIGSDSIKATAEKLVDCLANTPVNINPPSN